MKIKIYGTKNCIDCVQALEHLQSTNIEYEFIEFNDSIDNLKQFLRLRDSLPIYEEARKEGYIGIPSFVFEDGRVTLDMEEVLHRNNIK